MWCQVVWCGGWRTFHLNTGTGTDNIQISFYFFVFFFAPGRTVLSFLSFLLSLLFFLFVSFLPVLFPFSRRYIPVDKDEVFAFGRTVSRLNEMQSVEYLGETWLSGELASTKTQEREWVREFSLKIISEAELEDIWAR